MVAQKAKLNINGCNFVFERERDRLSSSRWVNQGSKVSLPNGKDRESCPTEEGEGDEAKGEHVVSDEAKEISGGSRAMTGGLFFASKGG